MSGTRLTYGKSAATCVQSIAVGAFKTALLIHPRRPLHASRSWLTSFSYLLIVVFILFN